MAYTKATDFLAKDSLPLNDAGKYIKGSELDTEFEAMETADAQNIKNSGALGTPASGTLTNCTGLPAAGVSGTALVSAAIGVSVQAYDVDTAKLDTAQTWVAAQTFRAANSVRVEAASTQDAVVLAGRAGGTSSYAVTLTPATLTGNWTVTVPDEAFEVGFRNVPQNSQSAAYTTVMADAGKHLLHPSADTTARTFTIDSNANVAYPVGTAITFVNQASAGVMTIAITTDTMRLAGAGTTGSRTLAANGIATAIKLTSTEWIISGTGLT